jgi:hypothetical protein
LGGASILSLLSSFAFRFLDNKKTVTINSFKIIIVFVFLKKRCIFVVKLRLCHAEIKPILL